jgi:hypothetical protein
MGELEPDDSRDVTLNDRRAPGEPPRTGPREGETRGQQSQQQSGQSQQQQPSDWRATEEGREAQDNEFAGDIDAAPSLRPEADDGQWSQQPVDEESHARQPQQGEPGIRPEAELRGPRESMHEAERRPSDGDRRGQAERGGG